MHAHMEPMRGCSPLDSSSGVLLSHIFMLPCMNGMHHNCKFTSQSFLETEPRQENQAVELSGNCFKD